MKQYKKLDSIEKMPDKTNALMEYLKSLSERQKLKKSVKEYIDTTLLILKSSLNEYYSTVKKYYTAGNHGRYPRLTPSGLKALQDNVNSLYTTIDGTKKELIKAGILSKKNEKYFDNLSGIVREDQILLNRIDLTGDLTLPSAIYKYSGNAYDIDYVKKVDKGVSFFEYSKIFVGKNVSEKSVIKSFMTKSKEAIMDEYTKTIESDPKYYEYSGINSKIPDKILNTGNLDDIEQYLNSEEADKLTYPEKVMLRKHMEIASKKKVIDDKALEQFQNNKEYGDKPEVINLGEDNVELKISQPAFQSSNNGCWSCAGQMLIQSRGVNDITQEDIRAYRPNLTDDDNISPDLIEKYNYDIGNNIIEKADSILAFAPNSMLRETQVMAYDEMAEKKGLTMEQYINNSVAFIKTNIRNAIRNDRSPVALLLPGHYITITGINGDTIKYKESAKGFDSNPNKTHVMSLKEFVTKQFNKSKEYLRLPISLVWMSDIQLAKDEKNLYGVPSVYTSVDNEGNVILPPENIQKFADANMTDMNKNGVLIQRTSGKEQENPSAQLTEDGVIKVERVYMPKKLNIAHLKNMAVNRDAAEEQKLIDIDKMILGIDRNMPVEPIEHIENDVDINQPEINNVKEDHYTLDDIITTVSGMVEEYKRVNPKWIMTRSQYSVDIEMALDTFNEKINEMDKIVKSGGQVSAKLHKESSEALKSLTESVEEYLSYKQEQFLQDPSRKNSYRRQINEQPKIKTTIDMLDRLYAINNSLNDKNKAPEDFSAENASRKTAIKDLRNSLLSNKTLGISNKKIQEATYKNCFDIDIRSEKQFKMMEAFFGLRPDEKDILPDVVSYTKIKDKKVSDFGKLKKIDNSFKAIGSDDPIDKLSNKDFIAIAAAASTTRPVYESYKTTESYEESLMYFISNSCKIVRSEAFTHMEGLGKARQMAASALTAYKNGDKKPLAHLINEGITNIVETYNLNKLSNRDVYQCMGELGMRLNKMMERDTDLRSLAVKDGLNPDYTKKLQLIAFRGKNCVRWNSYNLTNANSQNNGSIDAYPWSIEDRKTKYAEILFNNYFYEYESNLHFELVENPEYQREMYELSDKSKVEMLKASEAELKNLKKFYSKNPEMKASLNNLEAEYKEAEAVFKNEKKTSDKAYDNLNNVRKRLMKS